MKTNLSLFLGLGIAMKTKILISFFGWLCIAWNSCGQGHVRFTFEGSPVQPPGTSSFVQQYFESNMWFRPLGVIGPGNGFSRRSSGISFFPDNGSTYIAAAQSDSLVFSFTNGSLFGVVSVDLAEYSTVVPDAAIVAFFGYHPDGSVAFTNFMTDGIIDGTGPLNDFQTFYFGPEFNNLTRVEIPNFGWSLDNLVVGVPEPSTFALFVLGGAFLAAFRFRKR